MDLRQPRRATLVVIEAGATWPKWLDPSRSGDMVVVAPNSDAQNGPHNGPLIGQVSTRLVELEEAGWTLEKIVLVTNVRCEVEVALARSTLARGLIALLRASQAGELVLSSDQPAGSGVHHSLVGLAAALDAGSLEVSVRVGSGERLYVSNEPPLPAPPAP